MYGNAAPASSASGGVDGLDRWAAMKDADVRLS
jgi:hypothetical protein